MPAGTVMGTLGYMSPEQILGDKLDQRTDIWSLGVVFYQMLCGKKPFVEDAKRSVLQKIRLDRFIPVRKLNSRVPRLLERILGRCMEKQPADRYPSMQALIHDLEDFLASRVVVNYNAWMVKYLQDTDVISSDEASGILTTGAVREGAKVVREDRRALRSIGIVQAAVLAVFLFAGIIIQLAAGEPSFTSEKVATVSSPAEMGQLKVVAIPWARVVVDSEEVALTPIAAPISLPAGKHFVELVNPYFKSKKLEIEIQPRQTYEIVEELALDTGTNPDKQTKNEK